MVMRTPSGEAALAPAFKRGLSAKLTGGVVLLLPPALRATPLVNAGGEGALLIHAVCHENLTYIKEKNQNGQI